jgi:uncharacterized protein YuzE
VKIEYFPETDSLYIDLTERSGVDTMEVGEGVIIDLDGEGHPVGIDIDQASRCVDLQTLRVRRIPVEFDDAAGEQRRLAGPSPEMKHPVGPSALADRPRRGSFWDAPMGPPEPPSGIDDIPGLPPYDPEMLSRERSGFELMWGLVRRLFSRRPRDCSA